CHRARLPEALGTHPGGGGHPRRRTDRARCAPGARTPPRRTGGVQMKITDVEAMVVQRPSIDTTAADAMQDDFLVRVKTDEGITGIGEGNHTPHAMKALVDAPGSHSWSQGI